jgi:hypothetical protein
MKIPPAFLTLWFKILRGVVFELPPGSRLVIDMCTARYALCLVADLHT